MQPFHDNANPQAVRNPFEIKVERRETDTYGKVRLSVSSTTGERFAGMFIQARANPREPKAIGRFSAFPDFVKPVDCFGLKNSAVTHADPQKKRVVEIEWESPPDFEGDVTFTGTIVANYSTYWMNVKSLPVNVAKRSAGGFGDPQISQDELNMYQGCGSTKNCLGSPEGCIATKSCSGLATIKQGYYSQYEIEMTAKSSKYVALGFSEDNKMGGDFVVECVVEDDGPLVKAFRSWNIPNAKQNQRNEEQSGFTLKKGTHADSNLYCKLTLDSVVEVGNTVFDFRNKPYFTLLAAGSSLKEASVGYHDNVKTISPDSRLLSDLSPVIVHDEFYDGCNVLKNCFGFPDGCVDTQNCQAVTAINAQGGRYEFELKGTTSGYVALGLSTDNKMGGDSVTECVVDKSSNTVRAFASWNIPGIKKNTRQNVAQDKIRFLNGSFVDGKLYCKVSHVVSSVHDGQSFNLATDKFYVLLAAGSDASESQVGFHDQVYVYSSQRRSLSDVGAFTAASRLLIRLHGAFMIAAWIISASTGILLARYFKQTWVETQFCSKDAWFAWHRACMLTTWCLTLAGVVLIFVEIGEWVSSSSQVHAILGVITTILCFIQPIGAAFRPHPTAPKRPIFNWIHWFIGNAAHVVSVITIYFAVPLGKAQLPSWFFWLLVVFVVVYFLIHIGLSISAYKAEGRPQSRIHPVFPMKDFTPGARNNYPIPNNTVSDAPNSGLRKALLSIFLICTFILGGVMIVVVSLSPIGKM